MVNAVLQAIDYLLLGLAVAGLLAIGAAIDFWVIASCRLAQAERERLRFISRVGESAETRNLCKSKGDKT